MGLGHPRDHAPVGIEDVTGTPEAVADASGRVS
jgi:hypothetical protein